MYEKSAGSWSLLTKGGNRIDIEVLSPLQVSHLDPFVSRMRLRNLAGATHNDDLGSIAVPRLIFEVYSLYKVR